MSDRAFEEEDDKKKLEKAKKSGSKTPMLDMFARNLNDLAKRGKLDPVIGRDEEIDQMTQILNKRKKNNVLLIGQPGVGKTALAEGLAIKIANHDIDRSLWDKLIFDLNITTLISGTKYRGEFEARMKEVMLEVKANPDIIVFIDEMHTLVGAGSSAGGLDASNILKPALARGEVRCIGAMTEEDHKKYFESDQALDRRFQKVKVNEPSKEKMVPILMNAKTHYEEFHSVVFGDAEIKMIIDMCDRYVTYRQFPDKAIDVMDEVGAFTKIKGSGHPEECVQLEEKLKHILAEKMVYAKQQRYEDAAKMRDEQRGLQEEIDRKYAAWRSERNKNRIQVKTSDIAAVISKHSGVALDDLTRDQRERLKNMEPFLNSKVIGQEHAVKKVAQAIKRSKMEIQDPDRPFAMLFLGKTGTGKTFLAKVLARYLFDLDESFIRLDMSEYMDKFSVTKLIGAPPGYVGHEEKGGLTQKVKKNPYSIVLLDEIEKAHPDVFNMFLQVLEDGMLTDSYGTTVNFKNTIIIMTSNIGTSDLIDSDLGFNIGGDMDHGTEQKVLKELKKAFRPELLNRIDEKIIFKSIGPSEAERIIALEVEVLAERLKKKDLTMTLKPTMLKYLVDNGFDKEYGARPLKRLITSVIENEIAQRMLDEKIVPGDKFKVGFDVKKETVTIDVDHSK